MNHIITCNPIGLITSLKKPYHNWTVCHLHEKDAKFYLTKKTRIVYDIYSEDENNNDILDEWFDDESGYDKMFEMKFHEVPYLSEIPAMVSSIIRDEYSPEDLLDEDKESPTIMVAAEPDFSRLMVGALNRQFRADNLELEAINLMSYYQITEFAKLVEMIKKEMNSDFVYGDDPVSFAYVVNRMLRGKGGEEQ